MVRVLAISNLKGGSAKTTTAATVGAELAAGGRRVLLIDVDAQGHLAEVFGVRAATLPRDVSSVFEGKAQLRDVLVSLRPGLDLAPATRRLVDIEPWMIGQKGRETKLRRALRTVVDDYDAVLIDCPPSVGIYSVNAYAAASGVLVPMTAELLSLSGVSMLLDALSEVRDGLDHDVAVAGVVPTRVATRTVHAREVIDAAKGFLGPSVRFFTAVPESVAVRQATAHGVPVTEFAPENPAAVAYRAVAQELFDGAA